MASSPLAFSVRPRRRQTANGPELRDEIARVAYRLYEQRGRSDGHDLDDWLRAEALVRQRRRQAGTHII